MNKIPSSLVAASGLVAGYAVAAASGNRALGGAVLVLGGAGAATLWYRRRSTAVATALVATYLGAFVVSHPLAKQVGAWPSVLAVSAVVAASAWVMADRSLSPGAEAA